VTGRDWVRLAVALAVLAVVIALAVSPLGCMRM
jgi:hypothetical protein